MDALDGVQGRGERGVLLLVRRALCFLTRATTTPRMGFMARRGPWSPADTCKPGSSCQLRSLKGHAHDMRSTHSTCTRTRMQGVHSHPAPEGRLAQHLVLQVHPPRMQAGSGGRQGSVQGCAAVLLVCDWWGPHGRGTAACCACTNTPLYKGRPRPLGPSPSAKNRQATSIGGLPGVDKSSQPMCNNV